MQRIIGGGGGVYVITILLTLTGLSASRTARGLKPRWLSFIRSHLRSGRSIAKGAIILFLVRSSGHGRFVTAGTLPLTMAHLPAMSARPSDLGDQHLLHFLCLSKRNLLTIFALDGLDDGCCGCIFVHRNELRDNIDQEFQPARFRSPDVLGNETIGGRDAIVDIIACRNPGIAFLFVVVCADSKGAVWAGPTASADSMAIAVEDGRSEAALQSPLAECILEILECREFLALNDGSHFGSIWAR